MVHHGLILWQLQQTLHPGCCLGTLDLGHGAGVEDERTEEVLHGVPIHLVLLPCSVAGNGDTRHKGEVEGPRDRIRSIQLGKGEEVRGCLG